MSDEKPTTVPMRPLPSRPRFGWLAWEATAGYMSAHLSPDVLLKLLAYSKSDSENILWGASVTWAQEFEEVKDLQTPSEALANLWRVVDQAHHIFDVVEAAIKRPANYPDNQWFDDWTADIMHRLVRVTHTVFKTDWMIVIVYQPVESMDARIQARLIADNNEVHVGGRGASLGDGCRQLYLNAAKVYTKYTQKLDKE